MQIPNNPKEKMACPFQSSYAEPYVLMPDGVTR